MTHARRLTDRAAHANQLQASPAQRPATPSERRLARWVCVALSAATVFLLPFAQIQLGKMQAFLPGYQTAVIGTYLLTAYLMYGNYRATRSEALLHLSGGCLYTAGILVVQFLSFPGAFTDKGALIGGSQTTIWLWFFWHIGPAVGALVFAWSEYRNPGRVTKDHARALRNTIAVVLLAFAATVALTVFNSGLPVLDVNGDFSRITSSGIAPLLQVLLAGALVILWRASRFRNVLHLWLAMTIVALLCDNAVTMVGATRLSLGWYAGRLSALISSSFMMLVYLHDIASSYERSVAAADRLADSNAKLEVKVDEARLDPLTKLPRRDLFNEIAERLRDSTVAEGTGFATLYIDLDGFKAVNDRLGHGYGDIVLIRTAEALKSLLRDSDVAGRMGGDEFVVCVSAPSDVVLAVATRVADRIVGKIAALGDGLGASVGISTRRDDLEGAVGEADNAMFEAKKLGKNRSSFFRSKLQLVA